MAAQAPPAATIYEGARIITGLAQPPIERGSFVVQNGVIRAVGPTGRVAVPSGTQRVDLSGKTVMPAMVNVHVHIGYEGYTTWRRATTHRERRRSPAARALLRHRRDHVGGHSPLEQMLQVRAISAPGSFRRPRGCSSCRVRAAQRRAGCGAAGGDQQAQGGQRGDHSRRGARRRAAPGRPRGCVT